MTSDHHSLQGAGNPHSPAPSIPVYAICDVCGRADEQPAMREGMCRDCLGVVREAIRMERERQGMQRFDWPTAVVMAAVAMVIMWGWVWGWVR